MVNQLAGFGVGGVFGAVLSFVARTPITTDLTTYTFTAASLGPEAPDRVVLVAAGNIAAAARTLVAGTIAGGGAVEIGTITDAQNTLSVFGLLVPTGATGDIVVQWSGGAVRCAIDVFTLTGTGGLFAAFDSKTDTTGAVLSTALLDVPAHGAILASALYRDTTAGFTGVTWAGVAKVSDATVESASSLMSSAAASSQAAVVDTTITSTANLDSDLGACMIALSFAPA